MTTKQRFILAHDMARRGAMEAVARAPAGFVVEIREPGKTRDQEARYHAMIGDIARQWTFIGKRWHQDDVKRLLVDGFAQVMRESGTPLHHDGRVVPSVDGKRVVQLGVQTRQFHKREASEFIEYLFAFGAEHGIQWSNEVSHAAHLQD